MENKEFPEQENLFPEEPVLPDTIPPEEEPLIQELTFQETEDTPLSTEEAAPAFEELSFEEPVPQKQTVPVEEAPVFQEFPMMEEVPVLEDASIAEVTPILEETAPPVMEEALPPEAAEPAAIFQGESAVLRNGDSFMETIPDVEEDYPEEVPAPLPLEADDQEYRDSDSDFNEIFDPPQEVPAAPAKKHSPRKGRPKRKKGEGLWGIPNILATFVWLALILAIGVTAGRMLWVCAADVLAFGREDKPVTVTVYEADDMDSITEKLYNAGLIRYKSLFNLYASISDAEEKIQPGIYDLNTLYDYHALVNFMMPRSSRQVVEVTIPEGYTCRQIFALLEENRICTALDAAAYAANGELDEYWFLEGVERGSENCLEGFLFPDTYEFYKNSTPREALQRLLNNFENRFTEEMRLQIDTLNMNLTGNYTVRDVVIVASLIEKESARWDESSNIAGVIYNRLFKWDGVPAYLNIDAAIVYAQGGDAETIDTSLDSPYNTYTHVGLTPGPIANPGLSSLEAALNPADHDYYYYVLNPSTGMHQFSKTQDEHNKYISEFYGN